jgi:hypothetical protein
MTKRRFKFIVYHVNFFFVTRKSTGNKYRIKYNEKIDFIDLFKSIENETTDLDFYGSEFTLNIFTDDGSFHKSYKGKELEKLYKKLIKQKKYKDKR